MVELGFKYHDIYETMLGLSVEDYCAGPCKDKDQPGDVWIFGKIIENKNIYIKMKLASFGPLRVVRIISFHFAKDPLDYPFRKE